MHHTACSSAKRHRTAHKEPLKEVWTDARGASSADAIWRHAVVWMTSVAHQVCMPTRASAPCKDPQEQVPPETVIVDLQKDAGKERVKRRCWRKLRSHQRRTLFRHLSVQCGRTPAISDLFW